MIDSNGAIMCMQDAKEDENVLEIDDVTQWNVSIIMHIAYDWYDVMGFDVGFHCICLSVTILSQFMQKRAQTAKVYDYNVPFSCFSIAVKFLGNGETGDWFNRTKNSIIFKRELNLQRVSDSDEAVLMFSLFQTYLRISSDHNMHQRTYADFSARSHAEFEFITMKMLGWRIPNCFFPVIFHIGNILEPHVRLTMLQEFERLCNTQRVNLCNLLMLTDKNGCEFGLLLFAAVLKKRWHGDCAGIVSDVVCQLTRSGCYHIKQQVHDTALDLLRKPGQDCDFLNVLFE